MVPVSSRPDKSAKPNRDERRQSLIDAAKDLFSDKGYHATTVDDITRAAGVAKGTFYLYFGEKREVYYEVIRSFMELVKDIGGSVATDDNEPLHFFARAEAAALELMKIYLENSKLARLAYRESMGMDSKLEEMIRDFYRELAELEARNIQLGMDLGIIRPVHPLLTAYAHIGLVERVLMAMVDSPEDFPEPEELVRQTMRLAFEGLRLPGGPTPYTD
jgi:AcrR family transcriptional regulator